MPMFVFISGFLFQFQLSNNRYTSFYLLLKKKFTRIIIPYFIFGLIMMATTDNFHPLRLLSGEYWHLWFLPMIFWCFIISYGINKLTQNHLFYIFLLPVTFSLPLLSFHFPHILGFYPIGIWYCWFLLGSICFLHQDKICRYISQYKLWILLLLIYLIPTVIAPTPYGERTWYSSLSQIAIIICLWWFVHTRKPATLSKFDFTVNLSKYSYGVYIFHNWFAFLLISSTAQQLFNLPALASNHVILFPLCFTIVTFILSFSASWLLMKTKFGRFLIG